MFTVTVIKPHGVSTAFIISENNHDSSTSKHYHHAKTLFKWSYINENRHS